MTAKLRKKTSPQRPPTIITLHLPDDDSFPRTGTILIQRDTLAALRQFTYTDLSDIMQALQESASQLLNVERTSPVDIKPAVPTQESESEDTATDEETEPEDKDTTASESTSVVGDTAFPAAQISLF